MKPRLMYELGDAVCSFLDPYGPYINNTQENDNVKNGNFRQKKGVFTKFGHFFIMPFFDGF